MTRTLRPPRRVLDPDDAALELELAAGHYADALELYNGAIRTRAELAHRAHEAGLSWPKIAAILGVRKHTAMQLARRWVTARDEGRTLGIGPQERR